MNRSQRNSTSSDLDASQSAVHASQSQTLPKLASLHELIVHALVVLPATVVVFMSRFKEFQSFIASQNDVILFQYPQAISIGCISLGVLLTYRSSPRNGVIFWGYLAIGLITSGMLWIGFPAAQNIVTYVMMAPLALAATGLVNRHLSRPEASLGPWSTWRRVAASLLVVSVVGNVAHVVHVMFDNSFLATNLQQLTIILSRAAFISGAIAIAGGGVLILVVFITKRLHLHLPIVAPVLPILTSIGALSAILMLVLRSVEFDNYNVTNITFALAFATVTILTVFVVILASIEKNLASTLLNLGPIQSRAVVNRFERLARIPRWTIPLFGLAWLAAAVSLEFGVNNLHRYYSWGIGLSLIYTLGYLAGIGFLLTFCSRTVRRVTLTVCTGLMLLGAATWLRLEGGDHVWQRYRHFDKVLALTGKVHAKVFPSTVETHVRIRERVEDSRKFDWKSVLSQSTTTPPPPSRYPSNIFFISIDGLRRQSYGEAPYDSTYYPGLARLTSQAVDYGNTWTSYNATAGSVPAYFRGALHPVWWDAHLEKNGDKYSLWPALRAVGYSLACFTPMGELDDQCPDDATRYPRGMTVQQRGDPEELFDTVLNYIDEHSGAPSFIYLHAYNCHQPLLMRDSGRRNIGEHWMKDLYHHNVDYLDGQLDRFLISLEERGLRDSSMIILSSDHGEELLEFGGLYHGFQINPYVMHVPLFIQYPTGQPKVTSGSAKILPTSLTDIVPTILDVIGKPTKRVSDAQGVSLLRLTLSQAEKRSFPLLSWRSPTVGMVQFNPDRMDVLDPLSGTHSFYAETGGRWELVPEPLEEEGFLGRFFAVMDEIEAFHQGRPTANMTQSGLEGL